MLIRYITAAVLLCFVGGRTTHWLDDDVAEMLHLQDAQRYESFAMLSGADDQFACFKRNRTRANNIARNSGGIYVDARVVAPLLANQVIMFYGDSLLRNQFVSLAAVLWEADTSCLVQLAERTSKVIYCSRYNITVQFAYSWWLLGNSSSGTKVKKILGSGLSETLWETISRTDGQLKPTTVVVSTGLHWFQHVHIRPSYVLNLPLFEQALTRVNAIFKERMKQTRIIWKSVAPHHFEYGEWNTGGRCDRSLPYTEGEVLQRKASAKNHSFRQVSELSTVIRTNALKAGFEYLDTLSESLNRGDALISRSYTDQIDCVHFCVPGAPDVWNKKMIDLIVSKKS